MLFKLPTRLLIGVSQSLILCIIVALLFSLLSSKCYSFAVSNDTWSHRIYAKIHTEMDIDCSWQRPV